MGKILLIAGAMFLLVSGAAPVGFAQSASFSYNDGSGTPNAGSYAPGSSFTFSITLNFTPGGSIANLDGFSYWFEQQNPSAPFNFAITNRNAAGSQFTSLQTPGVTYPQNMTPQSSSDLGALLPGPSGIGAGNYFVANITVSISASAAPGTYLIENTTTGGKTSLITDDVGHLFNIPQATYSITVVPEPGSISLFFTGLTFVGMVACRRRARRRS
jgi:hypothetical protein